VKEKEGRKSGKGGGKTLQRREKVNRFSPATNRKRGKRLSVESQEKREICHREKMGKGRIRGEGYNLLSRGREKRSRSKPREAREEEDDGKTFWGGGRIMRAPMREKESRPLYAANS